MDCAKRMIRTYISILFVFCLQNSLLGQIDSTSIPLVIIDTNGKEIIDEPKITANLKIIHNSDRNNHPLDSGNVYDGLIGIEIRGRYSAILPQKPFGFETREVNGDNLNVPLFHMPPENDWILLANYNDKTFMRNTLAFELFRKMGHYAPRTQFCEVLINDSYQGIYVLTEKIKQDQGRVNISKLNPNEISGDDVTGGYIIKVDYFNNQNSWISSYRAEGHPEKEVRFVYHDPGPEDLAAEQRAYIQDFIYRLEKVIYSPNTPTRQHALNSLMNRDSFIDYFIIGELSRNVDAYKKSAYFYKTKDSKGGQLFAGPVWDYDWAWKNINECFFSATDGSGWAYKVHDCNPWPVPPSWMGRLLKDPIFTQNLLERYHDLRNTILSETSIFNYIDSVAAVLDQAQKRHYQKWRILGINVGTPEVDRQPTTFEGEIEKFKNWISTRLKWLDSQLPKIVVTDLNEIQTGTVPYLFPNPARNVISVQSGEKIQAYNIIDFLGHSIDSGTGVGTELHIDIRNLAYGPYILRLLYQNGAWSSHKIVKVD